MSEIHQNEVIKDITNDLKHIRKNAIKQETKTAIDYISKRIKRDTTNKTWKEFELTFKQVHKSFYKNLYEKYPNLTSRDKRLCALLILNLSSKEIAQITGETFKNVENARTRLRKKLDITNTKVNLTNFLNQFI